MQWTGLRRPLIYIQKKIIIKVLCDCMAQIMSEEVHTL